LPEFSDLLKKMEKKPAKPKQGETKRQTWQEQKAIMQAARGLVSKAKPVRNVRKA